MPSKELLAIQKKLLHPEIPPFLRYQIGDLVRITGERFKIDGLLGMEGVVEGSYVQLCGRATDEESWRKYSILYPGNSIAWVHEDELEPIYLETRPSAAAQSLSSSSVTPKGE